MKIKIISIFILLLFVKAKPDLVCKKVFLINKHPKVNDKVSLSYSIYNIGEKKIKNKYDVSLYINDSLVSLDTEGWGLNPKQGITYGKRLEKGFYHFIPKKEGKYKYKVIIDSKNLVNEENEKNNIKEGTFIVYNK
tara:strand:- start:9373 stop:9780 length:408 start_codon:yes stop_codon:yes gene_type:complete